MAGRDPPGARFGARLVARALRPPHRVLHTRQDWPSATVVLQIDLRSSLRKWRSAECIENSASRSACEMDSPMPRAWTRVTERIAKLMRSGWLAWTAFVLGAGGR